MSTFTEFTNILPDPNNAIGESGQAGGTAGPGYSSVKLASEHKMMNIANEYCRDKRKIQTRMKTKLCLL